MTRWFIFLIFLSSFSLFAEENTIKGKILDKRTKEAIPAYVMVKGTSQGVTAYEDGSFEIKTDREEVELIIYLIGYKTKEIRAKKGDFLEIELEPEPISSHEVLVTAESRVSDDKSQKTVTLTMMDVYNNPGAAGDPVYAAQILPGVNTIPDAANLIIRGGAPDEVGYYLDGIEIEYPYQSESLKEGYFSIFDNQMIDSFSVSTSGFSPRFGDALSGVVDISTKDRVTKKQLAIGLSILGLNSFTTLPFGKRASFIGSLSAGHSNLMTKINGQKGYLFKNGESIGKLIFNISNKTNLRLLYLLHEYRFLDKVGDFTTKTSNQVFGLTLNTILSKNLFSRLILSTVNHRASYLFPFFSFGLEGSSIEGRFGLTWDFKGHLIESGSELQRKKTDLTFKGSESFSSEGNRFGFYLNDKFRVIDNLFASVGIRSSTLDLINYRPSWDPRFSLAYLLTPSQILRFSAGIYHQFVDYAYMQENPDLKLKKSVHYSISYDSVKDEDAFRITLYNKRYINLFLFEGNRVTNNGYGYARGAELFTKRNRKSYDLIFVYNFLNSKRKEGGILSLARSPYEIDHSFTAIFTLKRGYDSIGIRWSYASGLPYTPSLGNEWDE
ncbi:MAG: TonB-dependent receptor, partial [Acidobacteriota bacterium]